MKISIIQVGKTEERYLREGLSNYYSRLEKMIHIEQITVTGLKEAGNYPEAIVRKAEAESISRKFKNGDSIVLLDEAGEQMGSRDLASFIQKAMNAGPRRIVFVIGGAWGLDDELKRKANRIISLSEMTFSHQLVRLLFAEQLYRAFTIIKGIPYHHY